MKLFVPQVLFSHKEPPLELMDTDAKVGENISYVTFGKYKTTARYNISYKNIHDLLTYIRIYHTNGAKLLKHSNPRVFDLQSGSMSTLSSNYCI